MVAYLAPSRRRLPWGRSRDTSPIAGWDAASSHNAGFGGTAREQSSLTIAGLYNSMM